MNLDDKICYCYHVPLRKLLSFARREKLLRPSQMSQCLGAGTGCGWCIPILKKIYEQSTQPRNAEDFADIDGLPMTPDDYAAARKSYLASPDKNTF
jgi:bacterioferritin-associated ferredoxin